MGKHKNGKKRAKESQLAIRVAKDERDAFVKLCEDLDTTAAREIRSFMRDYVAANSAAPVAVDDGAKVVDAEPLAEAGDASSESESTAVNQIGVAPAEPARPVENDAGKAPKKKHKS